MRTEFNLHGLNRKVSGGDIYATIDGSGIAKDWFHAEVKGDKETKEALWKYCRGHWEDKKIAVVEHDGIENGYPKNPVVVEIKEAQ